MFASLNPGHIGVQATIREALQLAEQYGFGGLDVQLLPLHGLVTELGSARTRDLFVSHGLQPGCWNLPFMPYQAGEAEWKQWLDRLPPMVAAAASVGARRAAMWIFPGSNEYLYEENFAFHVARFQPLARILADNGVRLGLEFVGPATSQAKFTHPFIRSIRETIELARAIGSNVGLLLDCWHWHSAGLGREDLELLTNDLLVHVHVNDAPTGVALDELIDNQRRLPLATGVIDLEGFMAGLRKAGYDGPVTAEPFDKDLSQLPADESLTKTARATRSAVALTGFTQHNP